MSIKPWHKDVYQRLLQDMEHKRLPHAILFHAPEYSLTGELAKALGEKILCEDAQSSACGHCRACRQLAAGANPDWVCVARLEDKKEILIDQIRQFCQQAQLTASSDHGRVGLILEADKLNPSAANALLKTLEEPPGRFVILLTAQRLSRVLPTIRSRCRCIAVPSPSENDLRENLGELATDLSHDQLLAIAAVASDAEAQKELLKKQARWDNTLQEIARERDPIAAAAGISEDDFDLFLDWWQRRILGDIKRNPGRIKLKRLWDAMSRLRRQGQGGNFKRLLALEGLFILYLQLLQNAEQGVT